MSLRWISLELGMSRWRYLSKLLKAEQVTAQQLMLGDGRGGASRNGASDHQIRREVEN